jgi:nucleoside-triphosphatase
MSKASTQRHLLLTGMPGSGKTTAIRRLAELTGNKIGGFYTEEIRERDVRRGFRLVSFDGLEAVIAHVDFAKDRRVGKYGVDVATIDKAVEVALAPRRRRDLYLIDEIGKMECLSERFVALVRDVLDGTGPVVATVARRGEGFIDEVKQRKDCELWTLARAERDAMPERILTWLGEC